MDLNVSIVSTFSSKHGFEFANITLLKQIPDTGNLTATIIGYKNGGCGPEFNGTGVLVIDPTTMPFQAAFTLNATYDSCKNTWDFRGTGDAGFTLDGIDLGAGAKIHLVYDRETNGYPVFEVNAYGFIGGVYTEMFYNASNGQFDALLDVKAPSLTLNATLHSRRVDCTLQPNVSQYDGAGLAQIELPNSTPAVLTIEANYSSCTDVITVVGESNSFKVFGVLIHNASFVLQAYRPAPAKRDVLPAYVINGTVSGAAEVDMGSMFTGSMISAFANFTGSELQYLKANVFLDTPSYYVDFEIVYTNIACNDTGAVWAIGSGDVMLYFANTDWLISGVVTVFKPCNATGNRTISTIVEGHTQLANTPKSILGFDLMISADIRLIAYGSNHRYFELWSHAMYGAATADVHVIASNNNESDTAAAFNSIDQFQFSFSIVDPAGFFRFDVVLDYHADCDISENKGMEVRSSAYFTLSQYGSFSWKLVGQHYPCAGQAEQEYFLDGAVDYDAPLTLDGLSLFRPSIKIVGTRDGNGTNWDATIRASIGTQFMGISDVAVFASVAFGTQIGLGQINVQMVYQNPLMLLSINIGYMNSASFPCSSINRGPNWSVEDFNPNSAYFQGGFGTADLTLLGIVGTNPSLLFK